LTREYKQFVNSYLMFEKLIKLPLKLHKPIPCDDDTSDDTEEENTENHIVNNFWNNKYSISTRYLCQQND
jgi:hypothetical protein